MKILAIVFAFCFVGTLAFSNSIKAKVERFRASCITETSIDPKLIQGAKEGIISKADERLGCYTYCMLRKKGIVEENGRLWVNIAKRQLITYGADALMADEMVNKCKNIAGGNECKQASNLIQCFLEIRSLYIF
ncbi:general odorant-binding protein 56h-like [Bombus vosnesenskii]|uniref:General odorant-binding protein 56h-like n=2 Tax=Pyrobombus TaxID=144703 RepID=A0A6J3JVS1_9HYME|nr:general odorant-binding protein 56h-like [Bombus vancouverensis nearcticus]XP_033299994.1 general odorant-binding protein 56h-like [Bombus bifarius]XP_033344411.1 general odorant-binding protein 56h-like [Bombus vosnesenskii]XP_050483557.1 general odorant-binding protein 56h-like [Bombus huntii]